MLRSIKLQFDSHRDIYQSTSIWSSEFMIPYILFILAWHSYIHFNLSLHTSSLIILTQSDFLDLYPYKQTNVENILYPLYIVSFVISPLLDISSLMHSWFILQTLIQASPLSNSSCSYKASHYRDQSKIINSCLICNLPNMLVFTWCYDIPQHKSYFIDSICIVVFCLN